MGMSTMRLVRNVHFVELSCTGFLHNDREGGVMDHIRLLS
jgi:hypothetical protein